MLTRFDIVNLRPGDQVVALNAGFSRVARVAQAGYHYYRGRLVADVQWEPGAFFHHTSHIPEGTPGYMVLTVREFPPPPPLLWEGVHAEGSHL